MNCTLLLYDDQAAEAKNKCHSLSRVGKSYHPPLQQTIWIGSQKTVKRLLQRFRR